MNMYYTDITVCSNCSRICEDGYITHNGIEFCHYEIESKDKTQSEIYGCYTEIINKNKEIEWQ